MQDKILIIDDSPDTVFFLQEILSENGSFKIYTANNGSEGLQIAYDIEPDLILSDIGMPHMNGYEVCEQLKQNKGTRDIPVIFLSAYIQATDKARGFEVGGIDYLTKPVNEIELISRINTHLKVSKLHKALKEKNEAYAVLNKQYKKQNTDLVAAINRAEENETSLRERIKELEGIYTLGLLTDKYDKLEELFDEFVNRVVPSSMQYINFVFVSLKVNNRTYSNIENYQLPSNQKHLLGTIKSFNKPIGTLIVAYTKDLPFIEPYEQKLIDAYAKRISRFIEQNITNANLFEAKRKAEENEIRFRSIIENTHAGYFFINKEGFYQKVNKAWLDLHKLESFEQALNQHYSVFNNVTDNEKTQQFVKEVTEGRLVSVNTDFIRKCKDGSIGYHSLSARPVHYNNSIVGVEGFIIDTTEQHETKKRIINEIIKAEEKERSHFARELHDGLGPLMSTLKILMQGIGMVKDPNKVKEFASKSQSVFNEIMQTISEVSSKLSPHILQKFGLYTGIKSFIEKSVIHTGIDIKFDYNHSQFEKENRMSEIYEITLYRIITELINNTIKHSEATKIRLKFDKKDHFLHISYTDNGIGCDLDSVLNNNLGLGMQNIQNRVKNINGSIKFVTFKNQGFSADIIIESTE